MQSAKTATDRVLVEGQDLPSTGDADDVLGDVGPGDYVALLGFVTPGGGDEAALRAAGRRAVRITTDDLANLWGRVGGEGLEPPASSV